MELDTSHGNAEETTKLKSSSNSEMLEQVQIEGTPFTAVRFDEKWFLTLGKYRLTEDVQSLENVKKEATDASWWRIMQIINVMIQESKEADKQLEISNQLKLNLVEKQQKPNTIN